MSLARFATPLLAATIVLLGLQSAVHAADTHLRVKIFPGPQNLPLFAARDLGFFARHGLDVEILFTGNSQELRDGLVAGNFEIAQAGVDNAVALVETAKADVVVVSGGSNGMNEFIVRPEIATFADVRGKKVVVDAPNTAYALLAYKALSLHGVKRDEYGVTPAGGCPQRLAAMKQDPLNAAAMLNLPCNLIALKDGYRSLGSAIDIVGPYQADGCWTMRGWAKSNPDVLVRFLRASIEGYRWAANPDHRADAIALIAKVLNVEPDIAAGSMDRAFGPKAGLAKDLRFDFAGFANTLKLRAEMFGGNPAADPQKYLDLSYYERALAGL